MTASSNDVSTVGIASGASLAEATAPSDSVNTVLGSNASRPNRTAKTRELFERVHKCRSLPSPPAVAIRVLELVERDDTSVDQIADLIARDPALAGNLLKTVNSAFYARSTPVATVSQAVIVLGLQAMQTLVLGFSLVTDLRQRDQNNRFNHPLFWQRSVYGATAARLLAAAVKLKHVEESFLAALLRDIGMLALDAALEDEYGQVLGRAGSTEQILDAEFSTFDCTHADMGAELAESWRFPKILSEPIRNHHGNDAADGTGPLDRMCEVVEHADRLAETFVMPGGEAQRAAVIAECAKRLNLKPDVVKEVVDEIGRHAKDVATLFEIDLTEAPRYEAILNQANDRLVDRTLRMQAETSQLQVEAAQMQEKAANAEMTAMRAREAARALQKVAVTDPLTNLLNRGELDRQLAACLDQAVRDGKPLALAMIDLDRFKLLNDTYGHPSGDAVLKHVARVLQTVAGDQLIAVRYGGEEMTLLMPGCDRSIALPICERFRQRVEQATVCCDGQQLSVTTSIGLAAFEPATAYKIFAKPAVLLKAADLALYHAKQGGRNRTKVCLLPPTAAVNLATVASVTSTSSAAA